MDISRWKLRTLAALAAAMVSSAAAQSGAAPSTSPPPSLLLMQDFRKYAPLPAPGQQPAPARQPAPGPQPGLRTPAVQQPGPQPVLRTPAVTLPPQVQTPTPSPAQPKPPQEQQPPVTRPHEPVIPPSQIEPPPSRPPILPQAEEQPIDPNLSHLKGIVVLGSFQDFHSEGVGGVKGIEIKGPNFLKGHKAMVSVWIGEFLGKALGTNSLDRLQVYLICACRQLDRPMVDVYYPEQEIVDGVVQVIVYEGKLAKIDIERANRAPDFSPWEIRDAPRFAALLRRHADPVSDFLWNFTLTNSDESTFPLFQSAVTNRNPANALATALNGVVAGNSIYARNRFKAVKLRSQTLKLLSSNPTGQDLACLNRSLLDDAFPSDLARKHFGKKWFSDSFLTHSVRIKPGDSISQTRLLREVERLNRDTEFLQVNAYYRQARFTETNTGATDIGLKVEERFPLKVLAGYDNYGLKVLGENQIFGGFNYGNLFGVSDQLNYQYLTDVEMRSLQAQSGSFLAPLPWGHSVTVFGGYNSVNADLSDIGYAHLKNSGYTYQISLRYVVPLPHYWQDLDHNVSAGFDFKSADTAITYGQVNFTPFAADVDQFVLSYNARTPLPGRVGYFTFSPEMYYSPGNLLGRNTDTNFSSFHRGLRADYYYGKVAAEFGFNLPYGFLVLTKGGFQDASAGLMPSEEFYLGGYTIARGYPEDIESGDEGYYGSLELHGPQIYLGNLTGQHNIPGLGRDGDFLDIFGFLDYGAVDGIAPNTATFVSLDSFGAGLTYHVSQNLKADVSYGFEMKHLPTATPPALSKDRSRGNISATLAF